MTHTPRDAHRTDELKIPVVASPPELTIGVFDTFSQVDDAVAGMVERGIDRSRISVVCSSELPELEADPDGDIEHVEGGLRARRLPAALAGGAIGTLLGGMSIAAGLAATGGAALLVAGPLIGGAALGVTGSFVGAMVARGLEGDVADYFDRALGQDKILVAVEPPEELGELSAAQAQELLALHGAQTHGLVTT